MVTTAPPAWFRIAAPAAIAWNAIGVFMYLHSVGVFGDPTTDLTEAQRVAAESIPPLITAAFATGTLTGLIGSIGLALRRKWAVPVLLLSAAALIVLEGWVLLLSGHREEFGVAVPLTVVVTAVLLAWLAGHARRRGWLG